MNNKMAQDDRILPVTRWVLGLVAIFLFLAFVVLYIFPENTRQNFAWEINPPITAVIMGAGYLSGAYMFVFTILGRKWHQVKNSLLPVSTFAAIMLLVTFLHYDRFIHDNLAFYVWLVVYIITPFLVPWLWFRNRQTDPVKPEAGDKTVPRAVQWAAGLAGLVTIVFWVVNFISPPILISLWPWKLTLLTARTMCAWGSLISVGGLMLFREPRWSAWRVSIQSITLWQALMVIGCIIHRQDFVNGSLVNGFFILIVITLIALSILYVWMELGSPKPIRSEKTTQASPD